MCVMAEAQLVSPRHEIDIDLLVLQVKCAAPHSRYHRLRRAYFTHMAFDAKRVKKEGNG